MDSGYYQELHSEGYPYSSVGEELFEEKRLAAEFLACCEHIKLNTVEMEAAKNTGPKRPWQYNQGSGSNNQDAGNKLIKGESKHGASASRKMTSKMQYEDDTEQELEDNQVRVSLPFVVFFAFKYKSGWKKVFYTGFVCNKWSYFNVKSQGKIY